MKVPLVIKAVVDTRSGVANHLALPGEAVVIERGVPRWLVVKCPCGCGDEVPINLDERAGPAWRLYRGGKTGVSLYPSVWRDTGCESHFVVWRSQILLFGRYETYGSTLDETDDLRVLAERVLKSWPPDRWASYVDVADELHEVPWDVLDACRLLVSAGSLTERRGRVRGTYRVREHS